jgi:tetratricopeptide (TPR) repeat protein
MHGSALHFPEDKLRMSPCTKLSYFEPADRQPEQLQAAFRKVEWPAIKGNNNSVNYFRQGMTQYYGLNYEEAMRNFKGAKKIDKTMAMASWGIALAAGSNINLDMTDACHVLAKREITHASSLAKEQSQEGCKKKRCITPLEKELIAALVKRYDYPVGAKTLAQKHAEEYRDAMAAVWEKHQTDKNISALYAESMLDVYPWDLYEKDGAPKPVREVPKILSVLRSSIGNVPEAIGANHYYIHAIEGSKKPSDAEPSANWLQTQVEASGHLVHMSSHIFLLVGDYQKSLKANLKGKDDDLDQYRVACSGSYVEYTKNPKCPQLYYGHYLSHNYFFGSVSATFMGQSEEAMKLACATGAHVERFVTYEPGLQRYLTAPLMTLVVNRNWDAINNYPEPPAECYRQDPFKKDTGCHIVRAIWYWAKGMRSAALRNYNDADHHLDNMEKQMRMIDQGPVTWGNNLAVGPLPKTADQRKKTVGVLDVGTSLLRASSYWAESDISETLEYLQRAVDYEDRLRYDEPPQWFPPTREALGGYYLRLADQIASSVYPEMRDYSEAVALRGYEMALIPFDEEIQHHPASGRPLYGRMRALQGIRRFQTTAGGGTVSKHVVTDDEVKTAQDDFCKAWGNADYTMSTDDLWPSRDASDNNHPYVCPGKEQLPKRPLDPPSACKLPPSTSAVIAPGSSR